ncbi:MAG: biotin/lipoyl-binding protein [Caldilineaceae bacterium]|nr:biotin/lipoyl-binding protein [Caldilineaceae bacterium]MBP8108428.1 biotin/lipoyl-binding protein [Caldilineaceae bacterium]MBP8124588.1 biotin/lipoyl-binding protein [Caldilineaceae bacterium]MBP9073344.1 biotin/lipoyl-binding protein [Caldilineaceae bacterium]
MKYFATIGSNEYEIEISQDTVTLNGAVLDVDLAQSGVPELYSLILGGASYEALIEPSAQDYAVTLRGEQFHVRIEDERTRRLSAGRRGPAAPQGDLSIRAPIPGLVVKILVEVGQTVEEGQSLVLLEAMKMENEIRAPRAGLIKQIDASTGNRMEQGAVLMVLG